ncbi:anthranilate phosphoribosyltransferase [Veillonella montpellierensis]|uniref:anthranilate phosphoribosyltransferase n=1 Tax=Veillonella montpellierensis TaxID=187328 RepID=UPI0023F8F92F|nr:anthranilate phosphoribosyltransferase [Veillonella montpellierensis]
MIKEAIHTLLAHQDLSYAMAKASMEEIMSGTVSPAQMGAFLATLAYKGETIEEITACAEVMRAKAGTVHHDGDVLEIVGTGGDEAFTFNISTTAGFVIAAAGVPVAKHGNRSVSSKCGAADVLEELGAVITLSGEQNQRVLATTGMCFMFAPVFHQSMKYAAPVRKEMGVRTVFNILGPLANPAGATIQLMGVYTQSLVEPLAKVLSNLGVTRGAVVFGTDGIDEISACASTTVCEINNGMFHTYEITPEQFGLVRGNKDDMLGGDKVDNAAITTAVLSGEMSARRTAVVLNAGMSIYLAHEGMTLQEGIRMAEDMIDSGWALAKMKEFIAMTQSVAREQLQ